MPSTSLMVDLWFNYLDDLRDSVDQQIGPIVSKLESNQKVDVDDCLTAFLQLTYRSTWGCWDSLLGMGGSGAQGIVFQVTPTSPPQTEGVPIKIKKFDSTKLGATPTRHDDVSPDWPSTTTTESYRSKNPAFSDCSPDVLGSPATMKPPPPCCTFSRLECPAAVPSRSTHSRTSKTGQTQRSTNAATASPTSETVDNALFSTRRNSSTDTSMNGRAEGPTGPRSPALSDGPEQWVAD